MYSIDYTDKCKFEWATGWHGSGGFQNKINRVFSSQTDSQGNLYILGECGNNAEMLNVEELLPNDNVVVGFGATHTVVILKMNPQGEILWEKQFFGLNNQFPNAHDLKVVGDSVVMFMINPAGGKISYFLDTVLTSPSEEYWWAGIGTQLTIVGTLDLDGNLLEKHSLQFLYEDNGEDNSWSFVQYLNIFIHSVFCVDNSGNIYIGRNNYGDAESSNLRVIIDNDTNKIFPIDNFSIILTNPSITKFSPHFDSVIWSRHIITAAPDVVANNQKPFCPLLSIDCDKYNNIYACGYAALGYPNGENYTIFYSENDSIIINDVDMVQSFLIKYDSIGNFLKYSGIKFTQTDSNIFNASPHTVHSKLQINAATNSLFTQTSCTQGVAFTPASIFGYFTLGEGHTDTTGRYRNGMFIQYDLDDLHYVSHGVAKSDIESGLSTMQVNNNRVFAQVTFFNNLDTLINYNNKYMSSSAFIYWDTDGHLINAICYKDTLTVQSNYIGPLALTDSIVYL